MNRTKYYTHGKTEVLEITDKRGQTIKQSSYSKGNCIIDILFDDKNIHIDPGMKIKARELVYRCKNHLNVDIQLFIKKKYSHIFETEYVLKHELIDNEICCVLYTKDINILLNYLILNIYSDKVIYKKCAKCKRYFGTKHQNAKYCNRIYTQSSRTCKQVGKRKNCSECNKNIKEDF